MFNSDWLLVVMPNGYGIYHCVGKKRPEGYSDPCERQRRTAADEKLLASLPTQEKSRAGLRRRGRCRRAPPGRRRTARASAAARSSH